MSALESAVQPKGHTVYLSDVQALIEHALDAPPRMFADEPEVHTVSHAAELLDVDPATIRREIARGRLGCFHVGKCVRITTGQLIAYIREGSDA